MIGSLVRGLPVAACDIFGDVESQLHRSEEAVIKGAAAIRRREFVTVRTCARRAARELGVDLGPLVPGLGRAPVWPTGVTGSLTHCVGYRAAVVALSQAVSSVGIDAEPAESLPGDDVRSLVLTAEERRFRRAETSPPHWDKLIFSVKESVFKAWWPRTMRWLGFQQVEVRLGQGVFAAEIDASPDDLRSFGGSTVEGRWLARHGFIVTCVVVRGAESADGLCAERSNA